MQEEAIAEEASIIVNRKVEAPGSSRFDVIIIILKRLEEGAKGLLLPT